MPNVSIIIPLYNKENVIISTIQSVLQQTYTNFELIIVDDGSTDNSLQIVKSIYDKRIHIYTKKNGGVSSARNYGALKSTTPWLLFLDADDCLTPYCLETLLNLSKDYPKADILTGNHVLVKVNGEKEKCCIYYTKNRYIKYPKKDFWEWNFMPRTGASIYSKQKFWEAGGFDEKISVFEDLALDIKLMNICIYAYTPKVVYEHYFEYSELSLSPKPLHKFFPYYIEISNQSFYEKLMLYSVTLATYYKFKKWNDLEACNYLKSHILLKHKYLYVIHQIYSKYKSYRKKILMILDKYHRFK